MLRHLAVCAGIILMSGCERRTRTQVGGGWIVETRVSPLPESGGVHKNLWRTVPNGTVLVDRDVWEVRYYPEDCVIYQRTRPRHEEFFVACGDRKPKALIAADGPDEWKLKTSGLEHRLDARIVDGRAVQRLERIPVAQATALGRAQEPLPPGWRPEAWPEASRIADGVKVQGVEEDAAGSVSQAEKQEALVEAVSNGAKDEVVALLKAGADVNKGDVSKRLALISAAYHGDAAMVRLLLDAGANVNVRGSFSSTPLMLAAREGHDEVIRLLVQAGAQTTLRDRDGRTAVGYAQMNGHTETAALLTRLGSTT